MPDVFMRWSDKEEIAALMNVSTGVCVGCKRPARVPEDVVAVHEINGIRRALIVCADCTDGFRELVQAELQMAELFNDEEWRGQG